MFFMYGSYIHIARKTCTLRFKGSSYIVMDPIFFIFLFSLYVASSSKITSVYSVEQNTYLELKNNHNMFSRKLNLPLKIQ